LGDLELIIIVQHPEDLFSVFMTMVVAEFIDHKQQDKEGDRQRNGKTQHIYNSIELVMVKKP
jgi:hypothetical protein